MLKDITLGQFFPGDSVLHRMDPRMKIILLIVYLVGVFFAKTFLAFGLLMIFVAAICLVSRINFKVIIKSLKPILFIIVFTAIINIFWTKGDTLLVSWGIIHIYAEGLRAALFMILRITALVVGTSVILSYTTSPVAMTDALERLLSPLAKIKVPVHEFSMMMSLALRFIPTLVEETEKILNAQKARGADFESGGLVRRAKAFVPILVPLFFSAFRRADELAVAMECRLYHGGNGRTRMKELHLSSLDFAAAAVTLLGLAGIILINKVGI